MGQNPIQANHLAVSFSSLILHSVSQRHMPDAFRGYTMRKRSISQPNYMSRNVLIRSGFGGLEAACSLFSRCVAVLLLVGPLASGRAATTPTFVNFAAPPPLGEHAGEPSIGVNWNTGNVLMQAGVQTLRVSSFDDATQSAHWQEVGFALTSLTTFDPLLFTDRDTGRTFVSQLAPPCSLMAFTDDDGGSWTPSPIGCGLASGFDHQSIGGGSFAPGLNGLGYPHTVFYVAQAGALANASLSI